MHVFSFSMHSAVLLDGLLMMICKTAATCRLDNRLPVSLLEQVCHSPVSRLLWLLSESQMLKPCFHTVGLPQCPKRLSPFSACGAL